MYISDVHDGSNIPIDIVGYFQIDDGEWVNIANGFYIDLPYYHIVTVSGHFSRDIPVGENLLFFIPRMFVSLLVDGTEIYTFGQMTPPTWPNMPGTAWATIASPGITTENHIKLIMYNSFLNTNVAFESLMGSLQTGTHAGLFLQFFNDNGALLIVSLYFVLVGTIAMLLSILAFYWKIPQASKIAALGFFAINGSLNSLFDLNYIYMPLIIPMPSAVSAMDITLIYLTVSSLFICFSVYASDSVKKYINTIVIVMCSYIVVLITFQILNVVQLYETQPIFYSVSLVMVFLTAIIMLHDAFKHNNLEAKIFLLTIFPAVAGGALDILNYFVSFVEYRLIFGTGLFISLTLQVVHIVFLLRQNHLAVKQKIIMENELTDSRISVMLSQIQPHFLYNTLSAIQMLCRKDPSLAEETIVEFTRYLRGNIDALSINALIPFDKELDHLKNYLAIEKKRFGKRLNVVYDINTTNFSIPALTVQPIVENAVQYGVTACEKGGTVTVHTHETEHDIIITVSDDGTGFDTSTIKKDGRQHVGVENVTKRLAAMCGGTLKVISQPNVGTTITLEIPKI